MWRFAIALAVSAVLHVAVLDVCCGFFRSAKRPVRVLPEIDLSSVELSFAEKTDDARIDTSDSPSASAVSRATEPSPPPAAFTPPVTVEAEGPEPPAGTVEVGEISIPAAPDVPVQPSEARVAGQTAARETARIDAPPSPRSAFSPAYPRASRRRGEEGMVSLDVVVGANGIVVSVAVAVSSGFQALDKAAMEAVRAARFEPAKQSGEPVQGRMRLPIIFRLTQ